jgi:nucleoside-diphosphate-sugar epimerase
MKLLALGGTLFLGRHLVQLALSRGHEVTLFTRGRTNPDLFQRAERLRGDRDGDLRSLRGRRWDAAVDTSGFVPRVVLASASLLSDAVRHYTFVSSCSVYQELPLASIDEDSPAPEREVQVIDGRDLATWILDMVEAGGTGVYNTVGPAEPLTMHDMLAACRDAAGSQARVEWVSDEFLLEQGVVPWTELPLWLPGDDPSTRAFFKVDSSRAVGAGLRFRPLTDTARDTLAWERRRTKPPRAEATRLSINAGIPRRREIELLEAWLSGRGSVREV